MLLLCMLGMAPQNIPHECRHDAAAVANKRILCETVRFMARRSRSWNSSSSSSPSSMTYCLPPVIVMHLHLTLHLHLQHLPWNFNLHACTSASFKFIFQGTPLLKKTLNRI